jgi:hypothetical protein
MGGYSATSVVMSSSGSSDSSSSSSRPRYPQSYGTDSLRHAISTRSASRRPVSPPRSQAERPRQMTSRGFEDHRSVSPLGTSRFEQPCSRPQRANTTLQAGREQPSNSEYYGTFKPAACEIPTSAGYYGNFGSSGSRREEAYHGYGSGLGLTRSNAVKGRENQRGFGTTGFSGGAADSRYEQARQERGARFGSDFARGGFSNWENY